MKKKIIHMLILGSALSLLSTAPAFAVDSLSIREVDAGDNNVRIEYTKASTSDRYIIRRNGKTLESDRLGLSGDGNVRLPMRLSNRETFNAGDKIEVTITGSSGREYTREYTIRSNNGNTSTWNKNNNNNSGKAGAINGFNVPITAPNDVSRPNNTGNNQSVVDPSLASTLVADKAYLITDSGKQSLNLTFNSGFVPRNGDFILAVAMDKSGKRLKTEEFSIPTVANASLKIDVEPPLEAVSYQFIFVSGDATNKGNARLSLPVKDGKDQVLALEKSQAYINVVNDINFKLKDKAGKVVPLTFVPTEVSLISTNHEGHTILLSDVSIDVAKLNTTGEGTLHFKTTEKGNLNLRLSAKDNKGNIYLSAVSTLSMGEDKRVIMTIGSPVIKVGAKTKTVDASPAVKANRTFVPLRALVESFEGATLKYSAKDKKIILTQDNNRVSLTLGSKNYQVNSLNKIMDVNPYVTSNKRTMVPVRVIAEALGYEVSFKKDGAGQKVIFEKENNKKVEVVDLV